MLTRLRVKKFKRFKDIDIDLGKTVVLVGPNNSGKTTVLQALALWDIGLKRWLEKKKGKTAPQNRAGITINRNDLTSMPVPSAKFLWKDQHVRSGEKGQNKTKNVRIDIIVDGITKGKSWTCGFEFDYTNEESFYCRPLRLSEDPQPDRMLVPEDLYESKLAYLPPMSGLADREFMKFPGEINVLIGQGQTAQVLRNLCYLIYRKPSARLDWMSLLRDVKSLFGVQLLPPKFIRERSEITMTYKDIYGPELDLSSAGRGLQQTLLLLCHLYLNPKTVLLLDEPDAHLEVLRQRQTYQLLTEIAEKRGSQIIAASHSEIVLEEAARRDVVIAFLGKPHRIDDRGSQVYKALKHISYEEYYMAEQNGWVLYLEGPTDLSILQAFSKILKHKASVVLERPFVHYVDNQPTDARDHFFGLCEARPDLVGIAIFDRLEKPLKSGTPLVEVMWLKKEIENYLCFKNVLMAYAAHGIDDSDLFGRVETQRREAAMSESIKEVEAALKTLKKASPWSDDVKVTDDFLDPVFEKYFERLSLPNLMRKTHYHALAKFVSKEEIDKDVIEKLDLIADVASRAKPIEG